MTTFSEIYKSYGRDVYRFAFWLCRNEDEAQEIAAETFARAWVGNDALRMESVKGYLLTIARNLVYERQRKRRPLVEPDETLPDPRPGPEASASARGQLGRVLGALDELPETDRLAVLMRARDAMSYREIARSLGISISAARVKVHRARLKLAAAKETEP